MLYNPDHIDEREILRHVDRWKAQQLVTPEQAAAIQQAYPKRFRQMNPWLELGAFLFTTLAVLSFYGLVISQVGFFLELIAPVFLDLLSIAYAAGVIAFARYYVQKHGLCRNGSDNAMLVTAAGIGTWAMIDLLSKTDLHFPPFWACGLLALPFLLVLIWYSGDILLTYITVSLLYGIIFDRLLDFAWGKALMPFVLMGVSAILFWLVRKEPRRAYYAEALGVVRWFSLAMILTAGNYYVVRELNALLLDPAPKVSPPIALPGLFWLLTVGLPLTYLGLGVRGKNRMLLILGMFGLAGAIAAFFYYYVTWPASIALSVCGALAIGLAVALIRYLRRPRHALTDLPDDEPPHVLIRHVGTLATIQATVNAQQQPHLRFGDGDFSGSGAGERY